MMLILLINIVLENSWRRAVELREFDVDAKFDFPEQIAQGRVVDEVAPLSNHRGERIQPFGGDVSVEKAIADLIEAVEQIGRAAAGAGAPLGRRLCFLNR